MFFEKADKELFGVYRTLVVLNEDNSAQQEMSKELFAKFHLRVARCKQFLYQNHPWFGLMLMKLKTVPTYDIPTMAVDDFGNIYMNPSFTLELPEAEVVGVFAHEVLHIMTLTFFRLYGRNPKLWNIATDFIMNRELLQAGFSLPKDGCIPVKEGDKWFAVIEDPVKKTVLAKIDMTTIHEERLYEELSKVIDENPREQKQQRPGPRIYKVGDRVVSKTTRKKGTIKTVQGLQPGKQTLSIEWD